MKLGNRLLDDVDEGEPFLDVMAYVIEEQEAMVVNDLCNMMFVIEACWYDSDKGRSRLTNARWWVAGSNISPTPVECDIFDSLVSDDSRVRTYSEEREGILFGGVGTKFVHTVDGTGNLRGDKKALIDDVLDEIGDLTSDEIRSYIKTDPRYLHTKNGQHIEWGDH